MNFINELKATFESEADSENAIAMKAYMKNKFTFYGIKAPNRKGLLKTVEANHKQALQKNVRTIGLSLFKESERELHYSSLELLTKYLKRSYVKEDISLIKKLLVTNSWWDSVDHASKWILGFYFKAFPEEIAPVVERFSNSDNIWLIRSTILFQLGYKHGTYEELLFQQCLNHKDSNEFFIQKAIGWALREYAKVNPKAVLDFANKVELKPLSYREAVRNIIK